MDIKIRVAHFDDDEDFQRELANALLLFGINIVLKARSVKEAEGLISQFPENDVQLAMLDGNMGVLPTSCGDGEYLAAVIRQQHPDVVTVGLSGGTFSANRVDIVANKIDIPGRRGELEKFVAQIKARLSK